MKTIVSICACLIFPALLFSASLTLEGSYTCGWTSSSAKTFRGTLESKESNSYSGDIMAPWNGKPETYRGDVTIKGNSISGKFVLQSQRRTFTFSGEMSGGGFKGDALEGGSKVGVLDMRISGGAGAGGYDYTALVSEAVSSNTGIKKGKVEELFENKGVNKTDVIAVCAAAEITGGDTGELYNKRKKFNTNFEFLRELKLDKESKTKLDALTEKIKNAVEDGKKKKK